MATGDLSSGDCLSPEESPGPAGRDTTKPFLTIPDDFRHTASVKMEGRRPRRPPCGHDACQVPKRVPSAPTSSRHSRSSGTMTLQCVLPYRRTG